MPQPLAPRGMEPPATRFRREIVEAVGLGASTDDLVLRLTLIDASKVKRDRDVPLSDIAFSQAGMRFLGVRVVQGGVLTSLLEDTSGEAVPTLVPAAASPKLKRAAKPRAKPAAA